MPVKVHVPPQAPQDTYLGPEGPCSHCPLLGVELLSSSVSEPRGHPVPAPRERGTWSLSSTWSLREASGLFQVTWSCNQALHKLSA